MIRVQLTCDGCGKSTLRESRDERAGVDGVVASARFYAPWASVSMLDGQVFIACGPKCTEVVLDRIALAESKAG